MATSDHHVDCSRAIWRKSTYSSANGECVEVAVVWRKSTRSSGTGECVEVATAWRKSTRSGANGSCVEIATTAATIAVRDSKNPDGPKLLVTRHGWATFLQGVKAGRFGQ